MSKSLVIVLAVAGLFLMAATAANAVEYTANFDADSEGWMGDGAYWGSTGGQDGGYFGAVRYKYGPYLSPPTDCILYGDVGANFGGDVLTFSYYLKSISNSGQKAMWLQLYSDSGTGTYFYYDYPDPICPADWTHYTFTVDTAAATIPDGWRMNDPTVGWANAWDSVTSYSFYATSSKIYTNHDHGIDTVEVTAIPEPSVVVLLLGLAGLVCLVRRGKN